MGRSKQLSVEAFLVILLLIVFSSAIAIIILQGSQTFENVLEQKNNTADFRVVTAYLDTIIRQNDQASAIYIDDNAIPAHPALVIEHRDDEVGLVTYVYHDNGYLWELYIHKDEPIDTELATKIARSPHLTMSMQDDLLIFEHTYETKGVKRAVKQLIARKGKAHE